MRKLHYRYESKPPAGWRKVSPSRYERDDGAYVDATETSPFWRPGKGSAFVSGETSVRKAIRRADEEWPPDQGT